MNAGFPLTVTLTLPSEVGIFPDAKSGALLHVNPLARLAGARFSPLISTQAFCAISGNPPSVSTVMIETALGSETRRTRLLSDKRKFPLESISKLETLILAEAAGPPS